MKFAWIIYGWNLFSVLYDSVWKKISFGGFCFGEKHIKNDDTFDDIYVRACMSLFSQNLFENVVTAN